MPLDARPWRTRHPDGVLVPQNRLSAILEARLGEHGVGVRRGSGLTGLTQDDDGVTATLAGGGSVRAAFLVACDGGHSTVRKLLGAPFPGRSGTMSAVTADIDLASAADTVARSATHFHTAAAQRGRLLDDAASRSTARPGASTGTGWCSAAVPRTRRRHARRPSPRRRSRMP